MSMSNVFEPRLNFKKRDQIKWSHAVVKQVQISSGHQYKSCLQSKVREMILSQSVFVFTQHIPS